MDLQKVKELQKNIAYFENSKEVIVASWLAVNEVKAILLKHHIDSTIFRDRYAYPILDYFIGVIHATEQIGDCPVMSQFLEYLHDKEVTSSELFVICINFRDAIVKMFFEKDIMNQQLYGNIAYVFNANFRGVLERFNDSIWQAKEETKRVYEASIKDYLTNVYNRKKFDELLAAKMKDRSYNEKIFSLILLDIDHFKDINDTYGHQVGDEILISLVTLLQSQLRHSDILARWGGEEFIILMPSMVKADAYMKSENLRKIIENYSFSNDCKISCSFGITDLEEDDTEDSLFRRIDKALYQSKTSGRNCITLH